MNKYGWKKDKVDTRDYPYKNIKPNLELPQSVDLRSKCSKVEDQGNLGSCTAQALVGNLEFLEENKKDLSRLFVYYNERVIEGSVSEDAGAEIRDGIKTLANTGVCSEWLWSYITNQFARKPWFWCYWISARHKISSYHKIDGLEEMKTCLADGFPFVFGFAVYESFESDEVAKTGIVPMPKNGEQIIGGHAVMVVGYDDSKRMVLVRNSWGEDWGLKGYFWMPYEYISNKDICDDFWTIRKF